MNNHNSTVSRFFAECRALLVLSMPIIASQLATAAMNFVDTTMAGQVSAQDLAAIAVGGSLWMPVSLLLRGILMALTPMIAHHRGAGLSLPITKDLGQTGWIALICSIILIAYLLMAKPILVFMDVAPEIVPIASDYLLALAFGVPGIALFYTFNSFCEGMSNTRAPMLIAIAGLLLNIPVNYVLIYGKFGLPALGAVGCGWATSLVFWIMAGLMYLYLSKHHAYQQHLDKREMKPDLSRMGDIFKLGFPIGINIFVCGSIFAVIALLIGKLGANNVASHQIALNFSSLTYMIPMSLSFGITIRTGLALGEGSFNEARLRAITGIILAACCSSVSATFILLFPEVIISLYTRNPEVAHGAAMLLVYASVYQISDALQSSANGVLRGFKDTKIPMFLVTFAYWGVAMPVGYSLGLTDLIVPAMGAAGFWIGLITGLTVAAVLLISRLVFVMKKTARSQALA
ncbi:MATE family efflux transporter [Parendozoicomonas haliclonae]|uniref:Multidrug-efflux transporter n=1 Tax=Parendozoicomonas haliclonae TaxID=1960125 RepID=A0A1X7AHY1_9GAMM|nr:MATE family efflux transporter [Parendozoicomonas haliclonae]SMA43491.1 Multidrug resistance protein MdtK [Parendozoicomonas haliclonae]